MVRMPLRACSAVSLVISGMDSTIACAASMRSKGSRCAQSSRPGKRGMLHRHRQRDGTQSTQVMGESLDDDVSLRQPAKALLGRQLPGGRGRDVEGDRGVLDRLPRL